MFAKGIPVWATEKGGADLGHQFLEAEITETGARRKSSHWK